ARPVTGVAGARVRARLGTATVTNIAGFPARHTNFGIKPVGRLFQRDVQCVLEIGTAIHLRTATAPASGYKDLAQDVAKRVRDPPGPAHAGTHARIGIHARMAEAVRSEEHTLNSSHVKISYAVFCL